MSAQQADMLTYEPYFGLSEKPFSLTADARFVFSSPSYVKTRDGLLAGIRRREGMLVLTGEIGTGKTTLCRAVLGDLGRNTYSSLVPDPFASREDLLKMLLIDFGVLSIQELTTGPLRQASRTELGYLLSEFLNSLSRDAYVVVMIDEAQNLSLPLIEETRLLSDTFGARGRLQIVFVGQPELHAKLKSPEMRQVDQRVCGYHRLEPMSRDAVAGYLRHRLQIAGTANGLALFPPDIVDGLHARTGGVPRLVNRICDRALLLAFEQRAVHVTAEIFDAALNDVGAATLSPTWDSIVFAQTPAPVPQAVATPAPQPVTMPAPQAVTIPVPQAVTIPAPQAVTIPAPQAVTIPAPQAVTMPAPQAVATPAPQAVATPAPQAVAMPAPASQPAPIDAPQPAAIDAPPPVATAIASRVAAPPAAATPEFAMVPVPPVAAQLLVEPRPAPAKAAPVAAPSLFFDPPDEEQEIFKSEVETWVTQDLEPPAIEPRVVPRLQPRNVPLQEKSSRSERHGSSSRKRESRTDTYASRLWRTWAKWIGIVVGVILAANIAMAFATLLPGMLEVGELPDAPAAPARLLPAVVSPAPPPAPAFELPTAP